MVVTFVMEREVFLMKQDYLEKYFSFRKAYCKIHIEYNPRIKWILRLLFPFRKIMKKFDFVGFVHQINSVLKMEELKRRNKNE